MGLSQLESDTQGVQLKILHNTGHAEAVEVIFDTDKVTYKDLLNVFWSSHDPTTLNQQGLDIGEQYRSAIFYTSKEQKEEAEESKKDLIEDGLVHGLSLHKS